MSGNIGNVRLLYVTPEAWPTFRADIRALFGNYLPRFGVACDLVTERIQHDGQSAEEWGAGRLFSWQLPRSRIAYHVGKLVKSVWTVLTMDRRRYDAVQVRDMPVHAFVVLLIARVRRIPFFYWMSFPQFQAQMLRARARGPSAGLKYWFPLIQGMVGKWLLFSFVFPRADHIFVQSETMQRELCTAGFPEERLTPVPMGIDIELADVTQLSAIGDPRLEGKRVLIYLGTLDRERKIEKLFEMLALVRKAEPQAVLVLAGDTLDYSHREWLRGEAQRSGVADSVIWTGWIATRLAWRYVRASEVALSPFPRGPLLDSASPTKTIEYLALGVAVVVNDNPDQAQVVRESGAGFCVEYRATDFSNAVLELLRDKSLRQEMANRGRPYVLAHRAYNVIAEALATKYRDLLSNP